MTDKCKSCGKEIRWYKTVSGRAMPVDAEPSEKGTLDISSGVAKTAVKGITLPGTPLHLSHFATCPNAKQHRKAK